MTLFYHQCYRRIGRQLPTYYGPCQRIRQQTEQHMWQWFEAWLDEPTNPLVQWVRGVTP